MTQKEEGLKRTIGIFGLTANLVNYIIGAGIFALPAIIAEGLGSASIFAYLFCGILVVLVMLCFAEVGSKITHPGGTYAYVEESFGKYAGFLSAILFIISAVSSDAAIANALVGIIGSFFPLFQLKIIKILIFFLLFSGLAYINIKGMKEGIKFVKIITLLKIIPLLAIVFIGFFDIEIKNLFWKSIPSLKDLGEMSLVLFFAFQGAESGLSINGEVKNPQKIIPRAIFLSVLIILMIYILIQTVAQGVLGNSLASFKENPLGELANQIFGPVGLSLITIGSGVSIFGSLSSSLLSTPRILFSTSVDKVIPIKIISKIHSKYITPYVAIIIYATMALLFASFGGFKQLAIISSGAILIIYFAVSLAVIKLRIRDKKNYKPDTFRIPGGYIVPIISALIILYFLSNLTKDEMITTGLFMGFISIIYLGIKRLKNS